MLSLSHSAKNCEGPEMLPYLQANKLTDVGGRHETLEAETEDSSSPTAIAAATVSAVLHQFLELQSPEGDKRTRCYLCVEWITAQEVTPEFRETRSFTIEVTSGEKHYLCLPRLFTLQTPLERCECVMSLQLCPTLCDPIDCSPPGFSVHRILQVRILEWVAMPSSRDLPNPGIKPVSLMSPPLAGRPEQRAVDSLLTGHAECERAMGNCLPTHLHWE